MNGSFNMTCLSKTVKAEHLHFPLGRRCNMTETKKRLFKKFFFYEKKSSLGKI